MKVKLTGRLVYANAKIYNIENTPIRHKFCMRGALTHSRFGAGEIIVLGHQVRIVTLAGDHLQHGRHLLLVTRRRASIHPKADVGPVAGELPPVACNSQNYLVC